MRFISADAIFDGLNFLEKGSVLVLDEKRTIQDILSENTISTERVEKHKGCLTPGFVNAHCHLELSHLKGKITQGKGLPEFARELISQRYLSAEGEILEYMQDAESFMLDHGIVAVGDICNTPTSFSLKSESRIHFHNFIELISLDPRKTDEVFRSGLLLYEQLSRYGLSGSLVPHAPYSVSMDLFERIRKFCEENKQPCSVHNQESVEEINFLSGKPSTFENLFAFLNIDLSFYKAPGKAGLHILNNLMPKHSILVHNTYSTRQDLELSAGLMNFWCFCPRANLFIENILPDFSLFKDQKDRICIGTDSLASNINLDLVQDANLLLGSGNFELQDVLSAICYTGARALGLEQRFGRIRKGTSPGINLLNTGTNVLHFTKKIC